MRIEPLSCRGIGIECCRSRPSAKRKGIEAKGNHGKKKRNKKLRRKELPCIRRYRVFDAQKSRQGCSQVDGEGKERREEKESDRFM